MLQTAPQVLDDGRLLYSIAPPGEEGMERWSLAKIVLQRPGDSAPATLVEGGSDPRYLSSGHLVYQAGGVLFARRFDPRTGSVGSAGPIVEGVLRGSAVLSAGSAWYRVSSTGTLLYVPGPVGAGQPDSRLAWFDRAGKPEVLPVAAGPYMHPRVSRDGKRIAFSRSDGSENSIWVYQLDGGGSARRLTFGGRDRYPIWSADSQWVIFQSDRGGDRSIYRQRADGSGAAERLTTAGKDVVQYPETAAPDGSVVLFNQSEGPLGEGTGGDTNPSAPAGRTALMAYSFKDRTSVPYGGIRSRYKAGAEFSPDGKWLAYAVAESDQPTVMPYVEPYPAMGAKYQMSTARGGGHNPMWSGDGHELFYTPGPGNTLVAIRVKTSPSFSFAPGETVVRPFTNSPPTAGRAFDAAPQGARFLGLLPADAVDPTSPRQEIRVVLNWGEELKSRVK